MKALAIVNNSLRRIGGFLAVPMTGAGLAAGATFGVTKLLNKNLPWWGWAITVTAGVGLTTIPTWLLGVHAEVEAGNASRAIARLQRVMATASPEEKAAAAAIIEKMVAENPKLAQAIAA